MTCIYAGPERPRTLRDRHDDGCELDGCKGCQPCPWPHCRRCGREHAEHTCPGCLADARADLAEIVRLCAALPAEAVVKGVDSEAMNLLGPAADPEAVGHMRASATVGRIPADWLEVADDERHPLAVLGWWSMVYVEAFEHAEPERITVASAGSYLDRNLAWIGAEPDVPFEDFARDLAACRSHLERVLHDGEQVETGAPCMTCRVPLRLVRTEGEDRWTCPRCRQSSTDTQYRYAVMHLHRENADWLTDRELEIRTGVKATTVRSWGREGGPVRRRRDSGRTVYAVEDVLRVAKEKGLVA